MIDAPETLPSLTLWRRLGAVVQGLVLGPVVGLAILNLIRAASDAKLFSYQGF